MLEQNRTTERKESRSLQISLARNEPELFEAQRLRFKVLSDEIGWYPPGVHGGMDRDIFDNYCAHLLVRESNSNRVTGTCRILAPDQAHKIGGYQCQERFDLTRLLHLSHSMSEMDCCCVHRDHRDGATLNMLWDGIAQHIQQRGHDYLIGCAGISMSDGGHAAASLYRKLYRIYSAPVEYRVFPRCPLPLHALNQYLDTPVPPLLKVYLRLGAWICGEPTWNPDFNTADLLMLLPTSRLSERLKTHFVTKL